MLFDRRKANKKAQVNDIIFTLVTITSIAMTMLIAGFLYHEMKTPLTTTDIATNESTTAYNAFGAAFPMFDLSLFFIVVALTIGLLVSSLFIPSNPIFIVINIVGFCVLVYLGMVFANLYGVMLDQTGENTTMAAIATQYYPITTYIMQNLPYIAAVLVLFASIIMYSKSGEYN